MEFDSWKRNPKAIHSKLKKSGNKLIATAPLKMYIPERWLDGHLGNRSDNITCLGMFCLVDESNNYSVSSTPNLVGTKPSTTNSVKVEETPYSEFSYDVGDEVLTNINMVRFATLTYWVFTEFISLGKVPFYFSYDDLCQLLSRSKENADANLGVDVSIINLILSSVARDPKDPFRYWRQVKDKKGKPKYIGLGNVGYSVPNTLAKLLGAYLSDAQTSALISETQTVEPLERLLRS